GIGAPAYVSREQHITEGGPLDAVASGYDANRAERYGDAKHLEREGGNEVALDDDEHRNRTGYSVRTRVIDERACAARRPSQFGHAAKQIWIVAKERFGISAGLANDCDP